ncbi:MAG: hypothetical protein HOV66_04470 [Streptomycetaceae bacterium]|nr:hypothetical protein [Streptomycetaceae bacterium]
MRTPVLRTALLAAAVAGALSLTACELPGKSDDKKSDKASPTATVEASPSAAASDAASAAPSPAGPSAAATDKAATKAPTSTAKSGQGGAKVLVSAARTGGYERLTGQGAPSDVPIDPGDMGPGMNMLVVAYGKSPTGQREVLIEGVDGLTAMDGKRMEHMIRGMIDHVNADGGSVPEGVSMLDYPAGPLGGTLQCMAAQDAYPAAICAWADKNTTVVAYFDKLSADDAAKKLVTMRADLEK